MAQLVEINRGSPAERQAQVALINALPASWIVTTNVDERNFSGIGLRSKTELDCVLITPLGVFILDFKDHNGIITPFQNALWKIDDLKEEENPLDQMRSHIFALKRLFQRKLELEIWIEGLVVFTRNGVELNWDASDIDDPELKLHVVRVTEVASSVRALASRRRRLSAADAYHALQALKPAKLPDNLFSHDQWDEQLEFTSDVQSGDASTASPPPLEPEPEVEWKPRSDRKSGVKSPFSAPPLPPEPVIAKYDSFRPDFIKRQPKINHPGLREDFPRPL